jgi:hypothetical protein
MIICGDRDRYRCAFAGSSVGKRRPRRVTSRPKFKTWAAQQRVAADTPEATATNFQKKDEEKRDACTYAFDGRNLNR